MQPDPIEFLRRDSGSSPGPALAYRRRPGRGPGVMFLGGFRSDMTGAKAEALADFCARRGQAFLRFDYSGHGASEGRFEDGTIGRWTEDALSVLDRLTEGPQILVGSSMGGWIALHLALRRPERVRGLLGVAAAPDFVTELMLPALTTEQSQALAVEGVAHLPSQYGPPVPITRALIEDGRQQALLGRAIPLEIPVRLLQGQIDPDVPWRHALRLMEAIEGDDVQLTLLRDGDHRLSRPQDLALLCGTLALLLLQNGA
ncbi:alpha/beta hydrolase [Roseomonas sp. NAR14]|uniref:Palmitoyl-protein thioesterase ABHD10, mitochondrial n=1 Tax=Roseomonas acroporae TaxID=2937791 RepID=A0A9X1Y9Z7_9PROT|nr:alpha/beta hydrolase [Roseomonas acroporae]MCK8785887.1 alpha/beta hydrolase [Roseomonas acroporae]